MNRLHKIFFTLLALASLMLWAPTNASAASDGVVDDAHIFSQDAISRADQIARQIEDMHKRQVLVQTFSAVPDDLQSKLQSDGKERFFPEWIEQIAREKHFDGVLILICMNPGHIEVTVGNETAKIFQGRNALSQLLLSAFKAKQYDRGLVDAMQYIADHMGRPRASNGAPAAGGNYQGGGTTAPPPVSGPPNTSTHGFPLPISGCVCAAIALVIILMLVASLTRRRGGYTGGYGPGPGGYGGAGYPPGSYPPGGYPQSGGGFGRGFLGGLLGGALGSWGYDRMRGNQGGQMGVPPPMGGANPPDANLPPDTSYSSSGGDFDSSSDPGGGMSSSGGDFGGSSGGDFGGSSGGDFGGGGGGDVGGGGGDSGGSSGGDF